MRWSRRGLRAPPLFRIRPEGEKRRRIIDMEIEAPLSEAALRAQEIGKGRPGTPTGEPLDRPEGYGLANYGTVFGGGSTGSARKGFTPDERNRQFAEIVADMDRCTLKDRKSGV